MQTKQKRPEMITTFVLSQKFNFRVRFFYEKTFKTKLNEFYDIKRCYYYYRNRYFFRNT
jgi:hypothetical protein